MLTRRAPVRNLLMIMRVFYVEREERKMSRITAKFSVLDGVMYLAQIRLSSESRPSRIRTDEFHDMTVAPLRCPSSGLLKVVSGTGLRCPLPSQLYCTLSLSKSITFLKPRAIGGSISPSRRDACLQGQGS